MFTLPQYDENRTINKKENNIKPLTLIDGGLMTFSIDINGGDIGYWTDAKKFSDNQQSKKINRP